MKGQADSRIWFQQRSGRVTASKLKSTVYTDPSQPSPSLIKSICYPDSCKFSSIACAYGCKHETEARQEYKYQMQTTHKSFTITDLGFVLDPMYPFMGASPDGLVNCSCCGSGVVEIKSLYTCKDKEFHDVLNECPNFFLYTVKTKVCIAHHIGCANHGAL